VSDDEADESTEDGLICKRKRGVTTEPPTAEAALPNYVENPPAPPLLLSPLGTFSPQTPRPPKLRLSSLLIRKLPPKLPQNTPPHRLASRLPSPSNLARVVVRTNPQLLPRPQAFPLLSKRP